MALDTLPGPALKNRNTFRALYPNKTLP